MHQKFTLFREASLIVDAVSSPTVPKKCTMFTLHRSPDITNQRLWSSESCRLVWMGKQLRAQWEMNYWGRFGISTCRGQYVLAVNHTSNMAGLQKQAEKTNKANNGAFFFSHQTVLWAVAGVLLCDYKGVLTWFLAHCNVVAMILGGGCQGVAMLSQRCSKSFLACYSAVAMWLPRCCYAAARFE